MTTPYSSMRCCMKDMISCFNLHKFRVQENEEECNNHMPKQSPISDNRKRKGKKKMEGEKTPELCSGGGGKSPVSWKSCESDKDDYIVFTFNDGPSGGTVIEQRGLEISSGSRKHDVSCNSWKKENEKAKIKVDASLPDGHKDVLSELSGSDTGSFSFPRMSSEWPDSLVSMPRPEEHMSSGTQVSTNTGSGGNHDNGIAELISFCHRSRFQG